MALLNLFDSLVWADKQATLLLNFDGGNIADALFYTLSNTLSWLPLIAVFACLLVKSANGNRASLLLIIIGLAVVITLSDKISAEIIKPMVMRLRPSHTPNVCAALHYVNGYHGGRYGFVSSHAANAFAGVVYASMIVRKRWFAVAGLVFALLVGYSRIYLGVHYVGDVVCGALLGTVLGMIVSSAVIRCLRIRIIHNFYRGGKITATAYGPATR